MTGNGIITVHAFIGVPFRLSADVTAPILVRPRNTWGSPHLLRGRNPILR
jgi:hypothetical protein